MLVLTWNLFHGRAVPEVKHPMLDEFTDMISGWPWDIALLQEVPPWWPPALATATGAQQRTVLTSRNALLPLRRWVAERRPDLIKSNGGGANAILVRPAAGTIAEHRTHRLRWWPERRFVHAVRLGTGDGAPWIANVHATANPKGLSHEDMTHAGTVVSAWSGAAPALLGGDANVPDPVVDGFADAGGHRIDRFFVRSGLEPVVAPRTLDHGQLSDHAPVLVEVHAR